MYLNNPIYLRGSRASRKASVASRAGMALFIGAIVLANYLVFFRSDGAQAPDATRSAGAQRSEELREAAPPAVLPGAPPQAPTPQPAPSGPPPVERKLAGTIEKEETAIAAFTRAGVDAKSALPAVHAMGEVFDFRKARAGDRFSFDLAKDGTVVALEVTTSPLDIYKASLDQAGGYTAVKQAVPIEKRRFRLGCAVAGTLYDSFKRCGADGALASAFADILSQSMDFHQDVRDGDEIKVVAEKVFLDGKFLQWGEIYAAEYAGKLGTEQVFRFGEGDSGEGYFDAQGQSTRRQFLRSPLKFSQISSQYSEHRFHPILHKYRKHLAVDYASPKGAPVWSVADGTVEHVGWKGGNGNLVAIRHEGGYTSFYAHLSKFAQVAKDGAQIRQGQIIGFVGATGRATGPHLHFALKHKGAFLNPLKLQSPSGPPVPDERRGEFDDMVKRLLEELKSIDVLGMQEKRV